MGESKGTFRKWKEKVNKKVNVIGTKTSYAMDRSKTRKQITQIQQEIVELKQEIGDIVTKNRNNEFTLALVEEQLGQIEEKENAIAQLETYIEEINELSRLADLEAEQATTSNFETINGTSNEIVEVAQSVPTTQRFTCSNCKQSYEESKAFCEKCGHKVEVLIES